MLQADDVAHAVAALVTQHRVTAAIGEVLILAELR